MEYFYTYIWLKFMVKVGKYSIHEAFGGFKVVVLSVLREWLIFDGLLGGGWFRVFVLSLLAANMRK